MTSICRIVFGSLVACLLLKPTFADEKPAQTIKGFGTVVDPDGDCQFKEENGKLTIVIPKTHHDLTYTDEYSKLNSPRILQDNKGDFRLEAKVETFELPKEKPSSGGRYSFVSSGLLIWQDDHNFIRMDRAAVEDSPFVWVERFQVRREKTLSSSGWKSRPAIGSLQPEAIEAAVEATKLSKPLMERIARRFRERAGRNMSKR